MSTAFIGIGSNLGDRHGNCRMAIERLNKEDGIVVSKTSSFYETEPHGCKN
ncbi:MAG: 2-amino-4-hydroxy-6-hydroxymethyldihydropteridine diphosphokinase, partial [Thermodesulfobacteriota bacterium]